MTTIIFVTGTNTDVGKTVTTASAIAATHHQAPHLRIGLIKPAQTGEPPIPASDLGSYHHGDHGDVAVVRQLLGAPHHDSAQHDVQPLRVWEGVRYPEPLAPDMAARRAQQSLLTAAQFAEIIVSAAREVDVLFVEGAGGLLVGLGEEADGSPTTLIEIAQEVRAYAGMSVSFLLVSQPDLGMLNQCALTWRELNRAGLTMCGIVFGTWPTDPDLPMRLNAAEVERITGVPVIGKIPSGVGQIDSEQNKTMQCGSVACTSEQWWTVLPWYK